jgi:uncharacterized protein YhaN
MSKVKQSLDESVSLFPFLSILACVIGILVLMITAITLGQIGKENAGPSADAEAAQQAAQAALARAERYKVLRAQVMTDAAAVRDLELRVRQMEDAARDQATQAANIAQARAELASLEAALKTRREDAAKLHSEREMKTQLLTRLEPENSALEAKLKLLREQLEKLRAALAERSAPPQEAQVTIQPSGSGSDQQAEFVECAATSIVLHDRQEPLRIPTEKITGQAEYLALLDRVKRTPKGTVIFLIRPDGVNTYHVARNVSRGRYVTNGKLAIAGQGKLDLSLFRK